MAIDSPDRDASLHTPVDRHYAWSDLTSRITLCGAASLARQLAIARSADDKNQRPMRSISVQRSSRVPGAKAPRCVAAARI